MSTAIEKMLARRGRTQADLCGRKAGVSKLGRIFRRRGVPRTKDMERIMHLPRRRWQDDPELETLRHEVTEWLTLEPRKECRRSCGHATRQKDCNLCAEAAAACVCRGEGEMELWKVQAAALQELHDYRGVFGPIRVGGGKTIIAFLAATVLGAARPLLLIPAKLMRKTRFEFAELSRHWLRHPRLALMSYELLSRDRGTSELLRIAPDLIIGDEIHKLKNRSAGCTRKVRRWMTEYPETKFAATSGTITTRSIKEYEHILRWCLPNHAPLPKVWGEVQDWADALDEKVQEQHRMAPGALLLMCTDEEIMEAASGNESATNAARKGYRRRLTETPGVVATEERFLGTSIQITALDVAIGNVADEAFQRLREDWETPDGWTLIEAMEVWQHARELATGFFYKWDPRPPKEWMAARKAWRQFVRQALKGNRRGIDTEFQVAKACKAGVLERDAYDDWVDIRDTFKPNTVPVWVHDAMLKAAAKWLGETPGLCWVEHTAFGKRLAEETGLPYFVAEGKDASGTFIEEVTGGPCIVSIAANSEGRNLQYSWSQNLIVSCPPNGRLWEQLSGRTHREGQEADEVTFDVALACLEQWKAFQQSVLDAKYIEHTTGQAQKLCYADVDMPTPAEVVSRGAIEVAWRE